MIEFRETDRSPAGIRAVHELLHGVFPGARHLTPAYLDWQYNRNPAGPAIACDAVEQDRLVGHYASVPLRFRLFGDAVVGALIVNLAVLPSHQKRGLMTELGHRAHGRARELGLAFELGIANANSTHGHHRTFGFQNPGALEARLGVGPLPEPEPGAPPLEFESLWDAETLRWRLENPSAAYSLRRRDDRCEVYAPSGRPGIDVALGVVDGGLACASAGRAPRTLRIWLGVDPRRDWSRALYWNLPLRLRPAPLNVVFKDLTGAERQLDFARVRIEGLDFDAY